MAYRLVIKSLATAEALEAFDYYESLPTKRGERFFEELDACYERILVHPTSFSYSNKPFREMKMPHFPYVIIYQVIDEDVIVYSVFNTNQNPSRKPSA